MKNFFLKKYEGEYIWKIVAYFIIVCILGLIILAL